MHSDIFYSVVFVFIQKSAGHNPPIWLHDPVVDCESQLEKQYSNGLHFSYEKGRITYFLTSYLLQNAPKSCGFC